MRATVLLSHSILSRNSVFPGPAVPWLCWVMIPTFSGKHVASLQDLLPRRLQKIHGPGHWRREATPESWNHGYACGGAREADQLASGSLFTAGVTTVQAAMGLHLVSLSSEMTARTQGGFASLRILRRLASPPS